MSDPKYSYRYKIIKGKYKGKEEWFNKKFGDEGVKKGFLCFIGKYKLALGSHGTTLSPVGKVNKCKIK